MSQVDEMKICPDKAPNTSESPCELFEGHEGDHCNLTHKVLWNDAYTQYFSPRQA